MVKLREAGYCNLKLFALYITVYAHLIEPGIYKDPVLYEIYRAIYFFHMPLFAFLSGLFLQNGKQCQRQCLRSGGLYLIAQSLYLLIRQDVFWHTPYWHLWYLLSLSFWSALGWLWHRLGRRLGWIFLGVFVILGCFCGQIPEINRKFSTSRSLVFLPYFWAGLLCKRDLPSKKWVGICCLGVGILLILLAGKDIRPVFLYQAAAYGENGPLRRLLCYGIAGVLCLGFLCLRPERRFPVTRAGADTMAAYLLHAPMVRFLWDYRLPPLMLALVPGIYLYLLYKIKQWYAPVYGISQR